MSPDEFDFPLPVHRIAQQPVRPRDAARLLVVGDRMADRVVRDLPELLRPGDVLVVNDTKVLPTRLFGRRESVAVEVTLIQPAGAGRWRALAKPGRRLRLGDRIAFAGVPDATVAAKEADGGVLLEFSADDTALTQALDAYGAAPLPPYIRRTTADPRDREDYQTVYAAEPGAVAAPTAGLHFTPGLLRELERAAIHRVAITLHVGAGTFLPIKTKRLEEHTMHAERGMISAAAADTITEARARGGRVVCVGTTALRLLETAADEAGRVHAWAGETRLFITPGYRFKVADLLLTNFHLPRSTLFILVCAFAGLQRMRAAYAHAIASGYRFYSYGDACLLFRCESDEGPGDHLD
jgi:S-adenosylmethionine:tRNA ribosyltransferase-isomerase